MRKSMRKTVILGVVCSVLALTAGSCKKSAEPAPKTDGVSVDSVAPAPKQESAVAPKEEIAPKAEEESASAPKTDDVSVDTVAAVQNAEPEVEPATKTDVSSSELDQLSSLLGVTVGQGDDLALFREIASWADTPFKSAGTDKSGADCSGFVGAVYQKVYNIGLPRQTSSIYDKSSRIDSTKAKSGDLVFFRTDGKTNQTPNYMGIYLKDNRIAVMSSKGLKFESLSSSYYKKNFVCAGVVKE